MIKVNVGPAGMVGWDGGNCIGIWVGADTYLYIYIEWYIRYGRFIILCLDTFQIHVH